MFLPAVYQIPVCPFCQRLEIHLALKGRTDSARFEITDITRPRPTWLLETTRGSTSLLVMETGEGKILKESLVILQYLEDTMPEHPVTKHDPYRRAVECMLTRMESAFGNQGYVFVMNQDTARQIQRERE